MPFALRALILMSPIVGMSSALQEGPKPTKPKPPEMTLSTMADDLAKFDKATAEIRQINDADIERQREATKKAGKDPDKDNLCLYATKLLKAETEAWEKTGNSARYWLGKKELDAARFPIPIFLDDQFHKALMVLQNTQQGKRPSPLDSPYMTGRIARLRIIARLLGKHIPTPVTREWILNL